MDYDFPSLVTFAIVLTFFKSDAGGRSLPECFQLFDLYHILATDHETVARITKEAIEDFAAENVVYLELRTTPKVLIKTTHPCSIRKYDSYILLLFSCFFFHIEQSS